MAPKVVAKAGAKIKAKAKSLFSYVTDSADPKAKAKRPTALEESGVAPDGNVAEIQRAYPDLDPETLGEIKATPARHAANPPEGTIYAAEQPVVTRLASEPEVSQSAAEFRRENAVTDPEGLRAALAESNTKAGMKTKMMAVQTFVIVALAAGGLAYFILSAKARKECIDHVFRKYPMFRSQAILRQKMAKLGDTCDRGEQKELCAQIDDAFTMLEECDNTLLRNIVGEILDIGGDVADKGLDVAGKILGSLGDMAKQIWPIVLLALGLVVLGVLGYILLPKLLTRIKAARAPSAAFGNARYARRYAHRTPR